PSRRTRQALEELEREEAPEKAVRAGEERDLRARRKLAPREGLRPFDLVGREEGFDADVVGADGLGADPVHVLEPDRPARPLYERTLDVLRDGADAARRIEQDADRD